MSLDDVASDRGHRRTPRGRRSAGGSRPRQVVELPHGVSSGPGGLQALGELPRPRWTNCSPAPPRTRATSMMRRVSAPRSFEILGPMARVCSGSRHEMCATCHGTGAALLRIRPGYARRAGSSPTRRQPRDLGVAAVPSLRLARPSRPASAGTKPSCRTGAQSGPGAGRPARSRNTMSRRSSSRARKCAWMRSKCSLERTASQPHGAAGEFAQDLPAAARALAGGDGARPGAPGWFRRRRRRRRS